MLAAATIATASADGYAQEALERALADARERSTFVLVDAFTTWCGPCKAFQTDLQTGTELRDALADLVFVSVDIEDSTSSVFNRKHPVSSVPQFILLDPDGVEHGRITGYGGVESFLAALAEALEDPLPVDERLARARADRSWEGPAAIASHHARRKEYEQAVPHYMEALDRGAPAEQRLDLLWAYLVGMGDGWATAADAKSVAEGALAGPAEVDRYRYRLYFLMKQVADRAGDDSLRQPFIERAVEEARATDRFDRETELRFDYAHFVMNDHAAAARARRDALDLRRNPYAMNLYAWYCFEHRVCLEEAERIAREGCGMDGSPGHLAMLTDTLAELVHLRGETAEALRLIQRCIELDPENEYYRNQDTRFHNTMADEGEPR